MVPPDHQWSPYLVPLAINGPHYFLYHNAGGTVGGRNRRSPLIVMLIIIVRCVHITGSHSASNSDLEIFNKEIATWLYMYGGTVGAGQKESKRI